MSSDKPSIVPAISFVVIGLLLFALLPMLPSPFGTRGPFALLMCTIFIVMSFAFTKYEGISLSAVNAMPDRGSITRIGIGFVIGLGIVGTMMLLLFNTTNLTVTTNPETSYAVMWFATLVVIPQALMEGLLFRSYAFFRLLELLPIRVVIWGSAILFGLYHLNESNTVFSSLLGPGVWGLCFAVAGYLSNSLAVPLGIHMAANFVQSVLGFKSHIPSVWALELAEAKQGLIAVETLGVAMQVVILIVSALILELAIRRKNNTLGYTPLSCES